MIRAYDEYGNIIDLAEWEKQIRETAIDDFLEKIQWEYLNSCGIKQREIEFLISVSSQVAERLKAGEENGIDNQ